MEICVLLAFHKVVAGITNKSQSDKENSWGLGGSIKKRFRKLGLNVEHIISIRVGGNNVFTVV